jgi:hypothetical protein
MRADAGDSMKPAQNGLEFRCLGHDPRSDSKSGRMLLITAPPGHEKYFDELRDLIAKGGKPDPDALAKISARHAARALRAAMQPLRRRAA